MATLPQPPRLDASRKERLIARFGEETVIQRLDLESRPSGGSEHLLSTESRQQPRSLARLTTRFLKLSGLYPWGHRNAQSPKLREQVLRVQNLPEKLQGLRILQLSDFHFRDDQRYFEAVLEILKIGQKDADIIFLTGDFIDTLSLPAPEAWHHLHTLLDHIERPAYAVLGNHDPLLVALTLEDYGVQVLLNESAEFSHHGASLSLYGVDDSARFRNARMPTCSSDLHPAILLAHTPHNIEEAARLGYDLYFCGHTHGGQICLPGGYALIDRTRGRKDFAAGLWKQGNMTGYTTHGLGTTGAHVRFFAPAEGVLHTLMPEAPA